MSYKDGGKLGKEHGSESVGVDHSGEGQRLGREEGSKALGGATEKEKEQRKLAAAEGEEHVFDNLPSSRQEAILQQGIENCYLGGLGGHMAWDNASPEEQQGETEASAEGLAKLSSNRQDTLKELGRQICHFGAKVCKAFDDATPEEIVLLQPGAYLLGNNTLVAICKHSTFITLLGFF